MTEVPTFNLAGYLRSSMQHYWRWHLGLLVGVAIACWAITGSLLVGDAVKSTLARQAQMRLGKISEVANSGEGFMAQSLAQRLAGASPGTTIAPVLWFRGTVSIPGGARRVNGVNIVGVDETFWKLAPERTSVPSGMALNTALAARLGVGVGEDLNVRIEKPSLISRDAPLSGESDQTAVIQAQVAAVIKDEALGAFSLKAEQTPALNLFVPLAELQAAAEQKGKCNLLLSDGAGVLQQGLADGNLWTMGDFDIQLTALQDGKQTRLSSPRIFLSDSLVGKIEGTGKGVLTYLCTSAAASDDLYTAYPMISAVHSTLEVLPKDLPNNGMVINQWMADHLKLKIGDKVKLDYFTVTRARLLSEAKAEFVVHGILPMEHPAMNPAWTPDFPGVSDAANCRDWKPGIPIKTRGFIKEADEDYWQKWKATPKAFIPLETGRKFWGNRFGALTSLRIEGDADQVSVRLKNLLTVADLGITLVEPQRLAQAAVDGSMNFGSLFVSMSFFLIATALALGALMFLLNLESRAPQIGLLRSLGFTGDRVRWWFLVESCLPVILGTLIGAAMAVVTHGYLLSKLETDWTGAVAGMRFVRELGGQTLLNGVGMTISLTLIFVWFVSRRLSKATPHRLLVGAPLRKETPRVMQKRRPKLGFWMGVLCLFVAALSVSVSAKLDRQVQPMGFFLAATLMLTGGICLCMDWIHGLERSNAGVRGPWQLGIRNAIRRRGRSLAIMGLLASGVFLVTALHTFHMDAGADAGRGTGGFQWIGSSDLPIYEDLNTSAGRAVYGIEDQELRGVEIVSFRQREGEEASCLNLNKAQTPSVLGVDAQFLKDSSFRLSLWGGMASHPPTWEILNATLEDGAIPAIADQSSALWALKKGLGDDVEINDAHGAKVKLRLVAFVSGTILQGHLIIAEKPFLQLFPDTAGTRFYLVETTNNSPDDIAGMLQRQLQNRGLALHPSVERLAQLQSVQNTYLDIFSVLGGIALVLSSAALALLIARTVIEREAEFGLMQVCGFRREQTQRVLLGEHLPVFLMAVVLGVVSALLAVWPHLRAANQEIPIGWLSMVLGGMIVGGIGFCILASHLALRRPLLQSLRQE